MPSQMSIHVEATGVIQALPSDTEIMHDGHKSASPKLSIAKTINPKPKLLILNHFPTNRQANSPDVLVVHEGPGHDRRHGRQQQLFSLLRWGMKYQLGSHKNGRTECLVPAGSAP